MAKKSNKKRADGRIAVQVYLGTVDGKRKYKTVYGKTQKEANAAADAIKADLMKGIDILSGENKTFDFWARAWLRSLEKTAVPEWHHICEVRTQPWIDYLGKADITKITTYDLQCFIDDLGKCNPYTNKPTSKKTLGEYRNIVCRIFEFCIQNRVLTFNPATYIVVPKTSKKHVRKPLTNQQINYFWETPHTLQTACIIMIYAGLRRGELLALTWNDIDFKKNTISVNKSLNFKNNGLIKEPKTAAGNRTITMPKLLADYLITVPKESIQVCTLGGRPITNSNWNSQWKSYLNTIRKKYNIEFETSAHCLRHTYCTILYEAGIDVLTAKELMGHSDISTTMGIYTHLRQEQEKRSLTKLDEYLNANASQMQVSEM